MASVFHAWAPPMLKQHSPGRNVTIVVTWVSPLHSRVAASFIFREQLRSLHPPAFFLPGTCEEKAAGQRISALGDEWAYAGCTPAYLTLSLQRVFTRSLHLPRPASLCGCEQSGLIWWKKWWRDGRQPVIGGLRCGGAVGLVQRPHQNMHWPFSSSQLHSNSESLALSKHFKECWTSWPQRLRYCSWACFTYGPFSTGWNL